MVSMILRPLMFTYTDLRSYHAISPIEEPISLIELTISVIG